MKRTVIVLAFVLLLVGCGSVNKDSNTQKPLTNAETTAPKTEVTPEITKEQAQNTEAPVVENSTEIIVVKDSSDEVKVSETVKTEKVMVKALFKKTLYTGSYKNPSYYEFKEGEAAFADFIDGKKDSLVVDYYYQDELFDEMTVTRNEEGLYTYDSWLVQELFKDDPESRYIEKYTKIGKVIVDGYAEYFLIKDDCTLDMIKDAGPESSTTIEDRCIYLFSIKL